MNRYIFIGLLCFVIGACTHHTTGFYEGPRYLSFVNEKGADTAFISFANYPGASTHEVAFVLKLTGNIPEEDLTYRLEVVDSRRLQERLTTNFPNTWFSGKTG